MKNKDQRKMKNNLKNEELGSKELRKLLTLFLREYENSLNLKASS